MVLQRNADTVLLVEMRSYERKVALFFFFILLFLTFSSYSSAHSVPLQTPRQQGALLHPTN